MSGRQGSFLAYIFVVQQRNILGGSCVLISRPPGCLHLRGKKTRRCKTHLNTNLLSWTVWQATKYMLRHVGYQDLLIKLHNFDKFHAISGPDRAIFDKKKCHSGSHQIIWKSKEIQHESGWPVHHQSKWWFLQRARGKSEELLLSFDCFHCFRLRREMICRASRQKIELLMTIANWGVANSPPWCLNFLFHCHHCNHCHHCHQLSYCQFPSLVFSMFWSYHFHCHHCHHCHHCLIAIFTNSFFPML